MGQHGLGSGIWTAPTVSEVIMDPEAGFGRSVTPILGRAPPSDNAVIANRSAICLFRRCIHKIMNHCLW